MTSYNTTNINVNDTGYTSNLTEFDGQSFIHPFSYLYIKIIFIILYSVVFAGCFFVFGCSYGGCGANSYAYSSWTPVTTVYHVFDKQSICCHDFADNVFLGFRFLSDGLEGNIGIIFLIIKNKALRTRTNFLLANLAVADFCVGNFCVLPNLSTFLSPAWILGKVMCKLYYFVQGMSYTASILLLTVIAIERYIAIMHPLRSRHLFTMVRLQMAQVSVWLLACCYNIPRLIVFDTVDIVTPQSQDVSFCFVTLSFEDMRTLCTVNFVLWYVVPLICMIVMYTRISLTLWRTSRSESDIRPACVVYQRNKNGHSNQMKRLLCVKVHEPNDEDGDTHSKHNIKIDISNRDTSSSGSQEQTRINLRDKYSMDTINSTIELTEDTIVKRRLSSKGDVSLRQHSITDFTSEPLTSHISASSESLAISHNRLTVPRVRPMRLKSRTGGLKARRKVIRLLMILLITFAFCVLPNHLSVLLHYWQIHPPSTGQIDLLPPISYLLLYLNSALNPALYWFFSESFRRSLHETFKCRGCRKH